MELKVIKPFHGKEENKVMDKGDVVHSTNVERINALVGSGYCVITSLSDANSEVEVEPEPSGDKNDKATKKSNK